MDVDQAGGPPVAAAAAAAVESPEERLVRLEDALDEREDVDTPTFLAAAAEVARQRWVVKRAAKTALKRAARSGTEEEKAEAAGKVELAEAEAKLAEAEAELAQAKADGQPTEALRLVKAALQTAVTNLKTHQRRPSVKEPSAKRLRVELSDKLEAPAEVCTLFGRETAAKRVAGVAEMNFRARGTRNHANHGFLTFNGHVRIGKTRMGEEVPRIIDTAAQEKGLPWAPAVYLPIRFQNGSQFFEQLDKEPGCVQAKLTARIAAAAGVVLDDDGGHEVSLGSMALRDAKGLELEDIMQRLADERLASARAGTVLPIVIHFDEYGLYVDEAKKAAGNDESNAFVDMLFCVGSLMANGKCECKYFIVPVTTGTSYRDSSLGRVSTYNLIRPSLRLLTPAESFQAARSFWGRIWARTAPQPELQTEAERAEAKRAVCPVGLDGPVPRNKHAQFFMSALADAGGYPGYIEMLCRIGNLATTDNYATELHMKVTQYLGGPDVRDVPSEALWAQVVRRMLTREVLRITDKIKYDDGGREVVMPVADLIERGYVMANWVPGDDGEPSNYLRLSVAPSLMRHWLRKNGKEAVDVFNTSVIGNHCMARPEHWAAFEYFCANFLAARLAALRHQPPSDGATLGHVLSGAEPRGSPLLVETVKPAMHAARVEEDQQWVVKMKGQSLKSGFKKNALPEEFSSAVRLCAKSNPIFDAYVDVGGYYLFLQYKHSALESSTSHKTSTMLERATLLEAALSTGSKAWKTRYKERRVVFVWVTNAPVVEDEKITAEHNVFYIGAEQLVEHVGAEFAGRGLVVQE